MRFEEKFDLGYFAYYWISHEELVMAKCPGALICRSIERLDTEVRFKLFAPTDEERDTYYKAERDLIANTKPWGIDFLNPPKPELPDPEAWRLKPLPEPIFTNVTALDTITVITRVYGGWLKGTKKGFLKAT
jgi:hypothetical protein